MKDARICYSNPEHQMAVEEQHRGDLVATLTHLIYYKGEALIHQRQLQERLWILMEEMLKIER